MNYYDDERDSKRTLTPKQRRTLYENAKGRCQNPACGKKIDFDVMVVGHKNAWSKGGKTTLRNCVCLCMECNKRQDTYNWARFLKKQGVEDPKTKLKTSLQALSMKQLKYLAGKHNIKVKGKMSDDFDSRRKPPTKSQYVSKLSGIVKGKEISSVPQATVKKVKTAKKNKKKKSDDFW